MRPVYTSGWVGDMTPVMVWLIVHVRLKLSPSRTRNTELDGTGSRSLYGWYRGATKVGRK